MDVKDIHSFMECYETRSINKAAKSLYISPQGLGKLLDRLEHEFRVTLFERTKQGLIPTDAGVFLYDKSQKLLSDMQEIEQGLELIRNKKKVFYNTILFLNNLIKFSFPLSIGESLYPRISHLSNIKEILT